MVFSKRMLVTCAAAITAVAIISTPNMVDAKNVRARTLAHGHHKKNKKDLLDDASSFLDDMADKLNDAFLSSSSSSGSFGSASGSGSSFSKAEIRFENLDETEDVEGSDLEEESIHLKKKNHAAKKNKTKHHRHKKHTAAKNHKKQAKDIVWSTSGSGSDVWEDIKSSSSGSFGFNFSTSGSSDEFIEIPDNNQHFEEVIEFDDDEEVVETLHIPAGQAHDITIRVKKGQLTLEFGGASGSTSGSTNKQQVEFKNDREALGEMGVKHSAFSDFERQNRGLIIAVGAAVGATACVIGLVAMVLSSRSNRRDGSMLSNTESSAIDEEAEEDAEASTEDALETGRAQASVADSLVVGEEDATEGKFEGSA